MKYPAKRWRKLIATVLIVGLATTRAHADDEWYGNQDGSGGGDTLVMPPYTVTPEPTPTFDWNAYWANQNAGTTTTGDDTQPPTTDTGGGGGNYESGTNKYWNDAKNVPKVTPNTKTSMPTLNALLQACKNNASLTKAMSDVKSTKGYGTTIWENGLAILIKPDGTVLTKAISGDGPNNLIDGKKVEGAFTELNPQPGDVKVFYHDHADQGSISDGDVDAASKQNTIVIARDGNTLEIAAPVDATHSVLVQGNTSDFGF